MFVFLVSRFSVLYWFFHATLSPISAIEHCSKPEPPSVLLVCKLCYVQFYSVSSLTKFGGQHVWVIRQTLLKFIPCNQKISVNFFTIPHLLHHGIKTACSCLIRTIIPYFDIGTSQGDEKLPRCCGTPSILECVLKNLCANITFHCTNIANREWGTMKGFRDNRWPVRVSEQNWVSFRAYFCSTNGELWYVMSRIHPYSCVIPYSLFEFVHTLPCLYSYLFPNWQYWRKLYCFHGIFNHSCNCSVAQSNAVSDADVIATERALRYCKSDGRAQRSALEQYTMFEAWTWYIMAWLSFWAKYRAIRRV